MTEPKIAQKTPYVIKCEKKKYAWCSCGLSENQPFCDGSHSGTNFSPLIIDCEEGKKIAWCGCKRTGNAPFCDGTHSNMNV